MTFRSFSKNFYWVADRSFLVLCLPYSASEGCMNCSPPSVRSWCGVARPWFSPPTEAFISDLLKKSTPVSALFLSKSSGWPAEGLSLFIHYCWVALLDLFAELTSALNASSGLKNSWAVPVAETSPVRAARCACSRL